MREMRCELVAMVHHKLQQCLSELAVPGGLLPRSVAVRYQRFAIAEVHPQAAPPTPDVPSAPSGETAGPQRPGAFVNVLGERTGPERVHVGAGAREACLMSCLPAQRYALFGPGVITSGYIIIRMAQLQ